MSKENGKTRTLDGFTMAHIEKRLKDVDSGVRADSLTVAHVDKGLEMLLKRRSEIISRAFRSAPTEDAPGPQQKQPVSPDRSSKKGQGS